ncbi:hypothetical protein AB0J83_25295 [Actinoplanes sp. NPDC049596]|uniref:hypothetical protein n=1 Tax=unclassified Actinoplanes TaxID=2626549 RepID=UPI00342A425C
MRDRFAPSTFELWEPMFDIQPDREPEPRRRPYAEPRRSRLPLSEPPAPPRTWWGTIPGQLSILVMVGGVILVLLALAGVAGPRA